MKKISAVSRERDVIKSDLDTVRVLFFEFLNQVQTLNNTLDNLNISEKIFRISSLKMQQKDEVLFGLQEGSFKYLELDIGKSAVLVTSVNSNLTQDQHLFYLSNVSEEIEVNYLAKFSDINLDIDLWSNDNFV